MNVLVTGGAGFIGSHIVDALVERDMPTVVVLDDLSGGFLANINPAAVFIRGTILDHALVNSLFEKYRFDYVYHLAAYAAEGLSHFIRRFNYLNNLVGSVILINAAVNYGVKCFVFTSSMAVYGAGWVPMMEEQASKPEDPYGIAKLAVEQDLIAAHRVFGLNYVIFRPHNVYGERQNIGDRYRNVIGIFMNQIMKGEPLTIFGDGTQTRAFSYVSDVVPAIVSSVLRPEAYNQVFNIGSDELCTINALAAEVRIAMDAINARVHHVTPRHEVKYAFPSHRKIQQRLGYRARVDLSAGLARMAAWVKAHGARTSKPFEGIEITRGLPKVWLTKGGDSGIEDMVT